MRIIVTVKDMINAVKLSDIFKFIPLGMLPLDAGITTILMILYENFLIFLAQLFQASFKACVLLLDSL